ncbi:MAG: ABC transporter permease subunit [Clostridia bacterium]|nr:ABC transporter permease subunit [Clostridia bacterium]
MLSIWKRELQGYFFTPVGYVFMGVFLTLSSVMFYLTIMQQRSSDLLTFIGLMSYLWMLLCPVLTMRLLAEEKQRRTDQLLLTSPVSLGGMVMGKYLSAVTVMLVTVLLTLLFVLIVGIYGQVYPGEMLVGYLGFILQGCAFIALDLFISGCASNQVTAAVMAFGANFVVWMLDLLESSISVSFIRDILSFFSLYARSEPFLMGQLSFASIGYDLSFAAAFLALTIHVLDSRRYRGI